MTMNKRWYATCDRIGCRASVNIGPGSWEKYDAGETLNDMGWAAAPSRAETYCEAHFATTPESKDKEHG